jgi:hypothetical protein
MVRKPAASGAGGGQDRQRVDTAREAHGEHREMGGNQDDPAPHRLHQLQSLHELIGVEMEVREYDAAASVHHGEQGVPRVR